MVDQIRTWGGFLLGAVVSGALAAGTLTGAPTANATCASFFGIGNSGNCTSTLFSAAVAYGPNAQAFSTGLFSAAISVGNAALASGNGVSGLAVALGDKSYAHSAVVLGIAVTVGPKGYTDATGVANLAISVAPGSPDATQTLADGVGNIGVNLFGNSSRFLSQQVSAQGVGNVAVNFGGKNSYVFAGAGGGGFGLGTLAFNAFGDTNGVKAGPGPFAIAGSVGQSFATVLKSGPGFNINGVIVGGAAAVGSPKSATLSVATSRAAKPATPAPAAASPGHNTKTAAPAATSVGHKK